MYLMFNSGYSSVSYQTSLKSRHLTQCIFEQKTQNTFEVTDKNKLLFTSNIYIIKLLP